MPHDYEILRIDSTSSPELQERVFRLRHEIYVQEMQLQIESDGERLRDAYDDYSTNFLLLRRGTDVGTIRFTNRSRGSLEIEQQNDHWKELIDAFEQSHDSPVAEITRFMVHRDLRGQGAAPRLLYAALRQCQDENVNAIFAAGKLGGLTRLYLSYCAQVWDETPLEYLVGGCVLGKYQLLLNNIRENTPAIMAKILRQIILIRDA